MSVEISLLLVSHALFFRVIYVHRVFFYQFGILSCVNVIVIQLFCFVMLIELLCD